MSSFYPDWVSGAYYNLGDEVLYVPNTIIYRALAASFNNPPPLFPALWQPLNGPLVVDRISAGAGITVNATSSKFPIVSTNLSSPNTGLTITNGSGTQLVLTNHTPASVAAGTAISIAGINPTGLTVSNTGLLSVTPGLGLAATGGPFTPELYNAGVVDLVNGNGIIVTTPLPGQRQIDESALVNVDTKNFTASGYNGFVGPSSVANLKSISLAGFATGSRLFNVSFRLLGTVEFHGQSGVPIRAVFYISDSPTGQFDASQSPCSFEVRSGAGGIIYSDYHAGTLVQFLTVNPPSNLYLNCQVIGQFVLSYPVPQLNLVMEMNVSTSFVPTFIQ